MSPASSPPQTPVTTTDELHIHSAKSPLHIRLESPAEHTAQPDLLSSQLFVLPLSPISSSLRSTINTGTSMSAIQSKFYSNSPPKNQSIPPILTSNKPSCLMPSEPSPPLQHDQSVQLPRQSLDSGITDSISLTLNPRLSVTPSFSFPNVLSSTTTCDHLSPKSDDSHYTLSTAPSAESISTTSQRMPNVYINGLPPHFSEQELFALTRPFGDIKSVRTFTRHVSEKPTGYGFVLFNDLESAQKCIEGLRKYRNFHPSFSKQAHRIPGTEYAQHSSTQSVDQDESTFKARMEKLKDNSSTNLYIEGLPLSIDEESLAALMLPYRIKSSRCFKTKLSNPPRIIAFVRLETRSAAEETIERLHGRMVRGWNDPGCRISVRFADSAEQRELRRTERSLKSGDQSPSRLTIAQAALLNLRGQELQATIRDAVDPKPHRVSNLHSDDQVTAFGSSSDFTLLPTSRSLPSRLCYKKSPLIASSDLPIIPEMDTLLQSIQNMGYDDGSLDNVIRGSALDDEYVVTPEAQLQALASAALLSPNSLPITLPRGHTQAHNGFTPAEELILEAHVQRLQCQAQLTQSSPIFEPTSSLRKIDSNVRSSDPAYHEPGRATSRFSHDILPTISEDDFHAMSHSPCSFVPASHKLQRLVDSHLCNGPATTSTIFVRPPNRAVTIVPPPPDYEEPGKRVKASHQHVERTTVPKRSTCPSSLGNKQSILSGENKSHFASPRASRCSNDVSNNPNDYNSNTIPRDKVTEPQPTYLYSHDDVRGCLEENKLPPFRCHPTSHIYTKKFPQVGEQQHSIIKEGSKSPAVVSPALTYSSRTPSTLSPATPFFGSFVGSQDAFEVMTMENEDVTERKLKIRTANK